MVVMKKGKPLNGRAGSARGGNHGLHRHLDTLARSALVVAISMGLPCLAHAGNTTHVRPSVHGGYKPTVVKAKNGTPVVNIVAPGKHGISHNTYTRLDVGQQGLIFNNSADISKTQLAGYVTGNAHLANSGPASIILNEVVSMKPSQLDGYMEIAGTPAELIIANPNGIACDGCGFINTPRAVLTTGKPVIDDNGRLSGFKVTQGQINIRGAGMDASHIDRVDLLARAVDINAKLWAQRLNVVAGANRIAHGNLAATPIDGSGDKPAMAIDVAALGGMYANAIRLVGTEAGVGVNIKGEAAAQAGDFTLTSAGKVLVGGQAKATGTVTVGAAESVNVSGVLASGNTMQVHGHALDLAGTVYSDKGIKLDADSGIRNRGQVQAHAGQLTISAGDEVANTADGVLYAGKDIHLDMGDLINVGGIEATHAVQVQVAGVLDNQGVLKADQAGLSVKAQSLENTGTWSAHDDIDAVAAGKFDTSGQLIAGRNITLQAGELATSGAVQAGGTMTLDAGSLVNAGKLYALSGAWQATIDDDAVNTAAGDIYAADGLTFKAAMATNHGLLEASNSLLIQSVDAFANSGTVQSDHATLNLLAGSLQNTGVLSAVTDMTLHADTTLDNAATVVAGGDVSLQADTIHTAGSIKAGQSLQLLSDADTLVEGELYALGGMLELTSSGDVDNQTGGDLYGKQGVALKASSLVNFGEVASAGGLHISASSLDNRGQLQSTGNLRLDIQTDIHNSADVQSGARLIVNADGNVDNTVDGLLYAATGADLDAGGDWHNAGTTYAEGLFRLATTTLHNTGSLRSGADMHIDVGSNAWNTGTAYALGESHWNIADTLINDGTLASADDTAVQAANLQGNGTFAAGLGDDGTLGPSGNLDLETTGALQARGHNLSAGDITLSGSALDLAGSQTFAGDDASLIATTGDINLRGAEVTTTDAATFTAAGALLNGGSSAADGGGIDADTLTFDVDSLDNRHGSIRQSGSSDLAIHLDGAFANAYGLLAANAGNLSIQTTSFDNAHGNLQHAGNGQLLLQSAGAFDNQAGTIAGNGDLVLDLDGALDNRGGQIGILGDVTLDAASLDNRQGTLAADSLDLTLTDGVRNQSGTLQTDTTLDLTATALDNGDKGNIKATGNGSIRLTLSGALDNAAQAFIGGNGDVVIEAAQLSNTGQIYAGNHLGIVTTSGVLDNHQGYLQAMDSVALDSAGVLDNGKGHIEAGAGQSEATLDIDATGMDNRGGRLANAGSGATTLTTSGDIDNRGGTLGGQGDVHVDADDLANGNDGKLVAGRDLDLALAGLDNAAGTVYAAHNLAWSRNGATLDNHGGNLGAGGDLDLDLGRVDNNDGNLDAGHDVTLKLSSLGGSGRVVAGRNLDLTLPGDYTNGSGNTLKANHDLSLTVGGQFDNPTGATLEAVHALAIHAAGFDNASGALLNSAATSVTVSGNLTNAGRIEGDSVALKATTFTNTGSVMGGDVTARARQLVNGHDLGKTTDNTAYQTALIAATHILNLYVSDTLLNQDASLFTLGDMTLAKNAAGDRSSKIINRSGDIEADGNIVIAAKQITNERRYYKFQTFQVSGNTIVGWNGSDSTASTLMHTANRGLRAMMLPPTDPGDPGGGPGKPSNTRTETTWMELADAGRPMNDYCASGGWSAGWQCKPDAKVKQVDTWTVTSATVLVSASAEGRILAGKSISLNGSLLNDASTVSAGSDLLINRVRQTGEVGSGTIGGESVRNIAHAPTFGFSHDWSQSIKIQKKKHGGDWGTGGLEWQTQDQPQIFDYHDSTPPLDGDTSFVTLNPGPTLSAHLTAGNDVSIHAHDIDNTAVDADGHPIKGAIALGGNDKGGTVSGSTVKGTGSVSRGDATGGSVALGDAPAGTSDVSDHGSATPGLPQTIASLTGPDAYVSLPQSGLYTIDDNPDSSYLVETDPRFADYAKFISSDYLLDHLDYDPAEVDKRLGDGFYEQRQVLDQITQLTGRRFLTTDTDALAQYRTLMSNAVAATDKFDLSVGVALTADQMAGLTRDIVWLVNETVDGQSVLMPVVYLSQDHAQQLAQSGAIIAGRNVVLDASGGISNNGAIVASQSASLKAGNLLNSGTLAAGDDLGIQAAHDILNQGGIIKGADVSLLAGHDVVSSADIGAVNLGGVDLGDFNTGGITATGTLGIQAGRDLTLDTSTIKAGNNMLLATGRDLSASAATIHAGNNLAALAGRDISLTAASSHETSFDGHTFTATTTHQVNQLSAGQNLTVVAGRDIDSQASQLKAGDTLGVTAGRDIHLGTVTDHEHTLTQWEKGHTSGTTVTDDDTLRGNSLEGTHGVHLAAGRDATLVAADLTSKKSDVTLAAGHDLNLDAGLENHTRIEDTRTHHSGLINSSTTTTHDVTDDDIAMGTQIQGDHVQLAAGHDLTSQGAQVQADKNLALAAGHDIRLDAAYSTYKSQHHRHKTKTHFGVGALVGLGDGQLYTKTNDDQQAMQVDHIATGTLLSGDNVQVAASHDITTQGAQVAATHELAMVAGHDLVIDAAANTHGQEQQHKHRVDGNQRNGLVAMVGTTKTRQRANAQQVDYSGSMIGSTDGSVSLVAGHDVHITGSDVISQTGTVITGQNVTIDAALGSADSHQDYSMHRAGITAGLGGAVGAMANSAYGAYSSAKRGGQVEDKRLKTLYAAQAGYQAYDTYKSVNAYAGTGNSGTDGTGISVKIALGASTANSHADTHDDVTYGSHIRSQGDIAIAATNGDLNVIGSQIKGDNVALAASHDLNLLSQTEQHTQKQSGAHAGGQIGVSIGQTTGIFLSVNGGKAKAHGNGTTHAITTVDADGTLSLTAGHDAMLRGAQARGDTILANIGHNLTLESEQDTGDFASKQWEAGLTLVYGFSNTGAMVSGHYSQQQSDGHYASVTQVTGLGAGAGGYHIHVGNHADLTGAIIASKADPSNNYFSTGSLSYQDIQNHASYSSSGFGVGASYNSGVKGENKFSMAGTGLQAPTDGSRDGTTQSAIAAGTLDIRNGDHTDISRDASWQNGQVAQYDQNRIQQRANLANEFVSTTTQIVDGLYQWRRYDYNQKINDKLTQAEHAEDLGNDEKGQSLREQAFALQEQRINPEVSPVTLDTAATAVGSLIGGSPNLAYVGEQLVGNEVGYDWTRAGIGHNETLAVKVTCTKAESACQNGEAAGGFQLDSKASPTERLQELEKQGYTVTFIDGIPADAKNLATNGIINDLARASQVMTGFVAKTSDHRDTTFYLQYNQTYGALSDLFQAGWDKFIAPYDQDYSATTEALAAAMMSSQGNKTMFGHSWGSITTANALAIGAQQGYFNKGLSVQVFGPAVGPTHIMDPMMTITGKSAADLATGHYVQYFDKYNDPVAGFVGGTVFTGLWSKKAKAYLIPGSGTYLQGSAPGDLGKALKGFTKVFGSSINPHSCYKNDCLDTLENWTVQDARLYATDPNAYFLQLVQREGQQNQQEQQSQDQNPSPNAPPASTP